MEDKKINLIILITLAVMLSFLVVINTDTNCYGEDDLSYTFGNSSYLTNGTLTMTLTAVSVTSSGKICRNDNCTSPED